jgi:hemolysin activation/secretion protein
VSGDELDALFGGGLTQFSFTVSGGQLDLSRSAADVASDQVANGADRQGNFNKLSWNIARLQRLTSVDTLALTFSGQKASKNLDSSEKFLATGPDAVRAFSSSEASGDEGMMLNLEWRRKVTDALTASVFYDTATLTRDRIENIGTLSPQSGTFSGVGVGLAYTAASSVVVRGSVAWRSGSNPFSNPANGNDADGSPKNPRVWLSLTKTF